MDPMEQDWTYQEKTKTIRTVPGNHWVCSMNSWDGALNHSKNAWSIVILHNKQNTRIRRILRTVKRRLHVSSTVGRLVMDLDLVPA